MNTVLQQLIEEFEFYGPETLSGNLAAKIVKDKIQDERKQIIDAGNNCANVLIANDIVTQGDHNKTVGENYYDQKFNPPTTSINV